MKIFVKPKMTDVGRGPEPVRLTYTEPGHGRKVLPPDGAMVTKSTYWVRRRNEGAVEFGSKPTPTSSKRGKPAATKEG